MREVYARSLGGVVRVGPYGDATFEVPVFVPDEAAAGLADSPDVRLGETLGAEGSGGEREGAYHAARGAVYHWRDDCPIGNNIEPDSRRAGAAGLAECRACVRLDGARPDEEED